MSGQKVPGTGNEDYKNHLGEVEDWPTFKITNDKISGRIPVTKIESWEYLPTLLKDPFFNKKEFIFRGQRKYSWSLSPTLARVSGDEVVRKEIAEQLLKDFKLKIRGRIKDYSILEDDNELWSVGQHHGLRTPLLDWTKSPFVALFFAFNEMDDEEDLNEEWEEKSNKYRCLYVLDKKFVEQEKDMDSVQIFEPRMDDHGRLVSQDGVFTISEYNTTIEGEILEYVSNQATFEFLEEEDQAEEMAQYICKIYIPNNGREECLKFLRKMNVHHASLFPDLIGASKHSNQLIEEFAIDLKEDKEIEKFVREIGIDEGEKSEEEKQEGTEEATGKSAAKKEKVEGIPKKETVRPSDNLAKRIEDTGGTVDELQKELTNEIKKIIDTEDIEEELSAKIAIELFGNIKPMLKTDWFKREPILADIRNTIRITFRSYEFYLSPGDERIGKIIDLFKSKEKLKQ
jgi:hypothetical protein